MAPPSRHSPEENDSVTLLIHATLATAPLTFPFTEQWLEPDGSISMRSSLFATEIGPEDAALVSSSEIALLSETHVVVPTVAVISEQMGTISMRVPVRPDEVERTPVRLYDVSGTAELLARATVEPFYGIPTSYWTREESAEAQVVIVEGVDAVTTPEAGYSEDLVRAWFILTGEPVVSHLLVVPKEGDQSGTISLMEQVRDLAHERRRDLRKIIADSYQLDRDRLIELAAATRFSLTETDRRALMMLLQRGNKGSSYPYAWNFTYHGETPPQTDLP